MDGQLWTLVVQPMMVESLVEFDSIWTRLSGVTYHRLHNRHQVLPRVRVKVESTPTSDSTSSFQWSMKRLSYTVGGAGRNGTPMSVSRFHST
jgi:hypothetical protein